MAWRAVRDQPRGSAASLHLVDQTRGAHPREPAGDSFAQHRARQPESGHRDREHRWRRTPGARARTTRTAARSTRMTSRARTMRRVFVGSMRAAATGSRCSSSRYAAARPVGLGGARGELGPQLEVLAREAEVVDHGLHVETRCRRRAARACPPRCRRRPGASVWKRATDQSSHGSATSTRWCGTAAAPRATASRCRCPCPGRPASSRSRRSRRRRAPGPAPGRARTSPTRWGRRARGA